MIIATAGHVDHGKTMLVRALTGVDTDTLSEEKNRGLTIDLGFAYVDSPNGSRLGFVDVPGHIKFINNMIAGVCAVDFALLVIAADDGPMPQTREHLAILDLLGVKKGAIALTKIDRVDEERKALVKKEIRALMISSSLENAEIFPVSALTNAGMEGLMKALEEAAKLIEKNNLQGYFRLGIDRCFSIKGSGIVVTGSVFSGIVSQGDHLTLQPSNRPVRVRGIRTQDRQSISAQSGDRCALNIVGNNLSKSMIHRGDWLSGNTIDRPSDRFDMSLSILRSEIAPISHWSPVHVHTAANHFVGRVALTNQKKLTPGTTSFVQIVSSSRINLCIGDSVIIRDQSAERTIGGGQVLDPEASGRGRAKADRMVLLKAIATRLSRDNHEREILEYMIAESAEGIDINYWSNSLNIPVTQIRQWLPDAIDKEGLAISREWFNKQSDGILTSLDLWHKENPSKVSIALPALAKISRLKSNILVTEIVARLISSGDLKKQEGGYALQSVTIDLAKEEQEIWEQIRSVLTLDKLRPPAISDLSKQLGLPTKTVEKISVRLVKTGRLVRLTRNRFFLPEGLEGLERILRQTAEAKNGITVSQYRDATGIGRNLAIEILEYFDRRGITKRLGDTRELLRKS
ncbi:MAG: selenocysteine-specific translation elongation factor [Candidatus Azotimanducaceae bacterium]|nr:selenocysteine-specific translation elongation factor [Gammaproteobacteria bacterium]